MANTRLKQDDVQIGQEIPWAVEDAAGNLLLRKGYVIRSQHQLETLMARGMYRVAGNTEAEEESADSQATSKPAHPFEYFSDFGLQLERIITAVENKSNQVTPQVQQLVRTIEELCDFDPDAALGMVHLVREPRYSIAHSLHTAILCELVARRLEWPSSQRRMLQAAALTANIAMMNLQEELQAQKEPLTPAQREAVQMHPHQGVKMLQAAGVQDELWLKTVLQHHERTDGSGYASGLKLAQICPEARLLAIIDRYAAMVSGRQYRGAIPARDVLKKLFVTKGQEYDETFALLLVKELSIFPPGGYVMLECGETAIVIKRPPMGSLHPVVSSFTDATGAMLTKPQRRNTAMNGYHIKDVAPAVTAPLNYASLWGYR